MSYYTTTETKLYPTCYLVEEMELFTYPTVMVMSATLHVEVDSTNDWYIDFITIDTVGGDVERLPEGHWLEASIRQTVNRDAKLQQRIYDACVEEGQ